MRVNSTGEKRTLSAIDALWIFLIAGALVLLAVGILSVGTEKRETREVVYILRVRGVDPITFSGGTGALIPEGSEVRSEKGTALLGRVESVQASEVRRTAVIDGAVGFVSAPDEIMLEIRIRGTGTVREGDGIRISDVRIAAGSVGSYRLGGYYAPRATVIFVGYGEEEGES